MFVRSLPALLLPLAFAAATAESAPSQDRTLRAELAWRTRALEIAWMATPDAEVRAAALPDIEEAVQKFFRLDGAGVAEALDTARARLAGRSAHDTLDAVRVHPAERLVEAKPAQVRLVFGWMYGEAPDGELPLEVRCGDDTLVGPAFLDCSAWPDEPLTFHWPDGSTPPRGDALVHVRCGKPGVERHLSLSLAPDLGRRLDDLDAELEGLPEDLDPLEKRTLAARIKLLTSLAAGSTEETDYPAARILAETEAMMAAARTGETWFRGAGQAGQHWLNVPTGMGATPVRLLVPESYDPERPTPLVLALHGMGGSENMFFDAYGAGRIAELCEQRGFLLASPRVSPLGFQADTILDALATRLNIDPKRIYVLGHSMGAGVGQRLVARDPSRFAAFVAMGGGSSQRRAEAWRGLPTYVTAGDRDFGRGGAESLFRALERADCSEAKLVIEPRCEHLLIVAEALPKVFAWIDGLEPR